MQPVMLDKTPILNPAFLAKVREREKKAKTAYERILSQYRILELRDSKRDIDDIIREVGNETGWSVPSIKGHCRVAGLMAARKIAYRRVHEMRPDLSFSEIGRHFNGRHHTTISEALSGRNGAKQ